MKVLIADDSPLFAEGLKKLLRSHDIEVVGNATNGLDALQLARTLRPDLVLMDIGMPGHDGLEGLSLIRGELPDVKVAMLTMYDDDTHLFEAIRQGAVGYLLKSMAVEELVSLIRGLERGEAAISRAVATRIMDELARALSVRSSSARPKGTRLADRGAPCAWHGDAAAASAAASTLTPRQADVLRRVARGQTYHEIASELRISGRTVQYHMGEILRKLHLRNRTEVIVYAHCTAAGT